MRRLSAAYLILITVLTVPALSQNFEFYPNARYDASIPTLEQTTGHSWGEKITMHHEAVHYLRALAEASPKVKLITFGETWEGRSLNYVIVASEANMARLDDVQKANLSLTDPRNLGENDANDLIENSPSIVWLSYGVHGNEISSPDAALLTAYHLAAAQGDTLTDTVLQNSIVIIDPMQNPDGRDRFINYFRQTRGRWPDGDPQAAEHRENWPGGRTNHYLFDLNRDWFAQTQPESKARVKVFQEWRPQVFVDLHEMGSNSSYFFPPTPLPINPEYSESQVQGFEMYGRNNSKWFDIMKFDYFNREVFDSFYPGYGASWPTLNGAVAMTYEQGSSRGLVVDRDDETTMHFRETVQHHFIASLATAETAAVNRRKVLQDFYDYWQSGIEEGRTETVKEYIITPKGDAGRAEKLAALLAGQGIEVKQAKASFSNSQVQDYFGGAVQNMEFPAGSFIVSLAQPSKRLLKTLMAKEIPMTDAFIQEQLRRRKKRLGDQIYDITAWSLPLLFDVSCYRARTASSGDFQDYDGQASSGRVSAKAELAYLIPWGAHSAVRALARLFREDIRVFSTDKPFTMSGEKYPAGTLIVKTKNNPDDLHARLEKIAAETGAEITATNSSWVEEGVNFGSNNVQFLKKPKIALAYNRPVSAYSVGWTRYLIEQAYGYPVTLLHANQLSGADLSKYNVLVLPDARGGYSSAISESGVGRIKDWLRSGGTLVTYANGALWLSDKKVGLLATEREQKGGKPEKEKKEKPNADAPFDVEKAIQPEKEWPAAISGAICRVALDGEHWLGFGYDGDTNVMMQSNRIFTPLKLDKGRNVGLYAAEDDLVVSGFTWEETKKQLANKAFLMHQRFGRGNVVAFAEDPNFRAYMDGLNVLLFNALFFGPSH